MTSLTPEQRLEIRKAGEEPVRIDDPETQTEFGTAPNTPANTVGCRNRSTFCPSRPTTSRVVHPRSSS